MRLRLKELYKSDGEQSIVYHVETLDLKDLGVKPGDTIKLEAEIESIAPEAASIGGKITRNEKLIAEIDLMFSHIDQNLAGKDFPEENFVFGSGDDGSVFESLIRDAVSRGSCNPEPN